MIDLEPIVDDLRCDKLARGDKVVLIQELLIDSGYRLQEIDKYIKNLNWSVLENG